MENPTPPQSALGQECQLSSSGHLPAWAATTPWDPLKSGERASPHGEERRSLGEQHLP